MPHLRICGHRGHSVDAPENTLAAFRAARQLGGTDCEIDTVLTADGEIVVLHDLLLDRTTTGRGAVFSHTASQVATLDAGSWFDSAFAAERVPTLDRALTLAEELDLAYEIEIKEVRDLDTYLMRLAELLSTPERLARVHVISFDHVALSVAKDRIPGLRTGGIVHERFADPVHVARSARLDRLCIDLDRFDLADAERIKAAGISIRCHAFSPVVLEDVAAAGLPWLDTLAKAIRSDLVDVVSSDDVAWARAFVADALAAAG